MQDLATTLKDLQLRLELIEKRLGMAPAPEKPAAGPTATTRSAQSVPPPQIAGVSIAGAHAKESTSTFLGTVGVICFILAGVLIIRLSIDSGWLTPGRQVFLAAAFGFSLVVSGFLPVSKDPRYSSLLPAAGVVILNLAAYGGFFIHSLYDPSVALALVFVISALALMLFAVWETDFYAVAATVGTYLGAYVLGEKVWDAPTLLGILLAWAITFSFLSVWLRSRLLILISAYLALGALPMRGLSPSLAPGDLALLCIVQGLQFLIFLVGVANYSVKHRAPLTQSEAWSFFPLVLFFYATEYWLLNRLVPEWTPWLGLGFAAAIFLFQRVMAARVSKSTEESAEMVSAACGIIFLHAFYIVLLPDTLKPVAGLFMGVATVLMRPWDRGGKGWSGLYLATALMVSSGYVLALTGAGGTVQSTVLSGFAFGIAMLAIYAIVSGALHERKRSQDGLLLLGAAHLQVLVALYRLTEYGPELLSRSLQVSLAWAAYAVLVLMWGMAKREAPLARSSLMVLMFCTCKVFIYDVLNATSGARIISLIVLGVVLYGFGAIYKKVEDFK